MPVLPAALVPVAAEVGSDSRDGDEVEGPGRDVLVAAGTEVGLRGLVGLDEAGVAVVGEGVDRAHPNTAQATSRATTTNAPTTMAMSAAETP